MYRSVLVPVDGSEFGEQAIPLAAAVARRSGATLHLAHVHVPLIAPSGIETVAFRGAWVDATKQQERGYLDGLVERVSRAHDVRVESCLVDGAVAPALENYARDCGASLVVMSTHAHTGLSRLWHHGVADQIARDLPLPVLLVHPREGAGAPDLERTPEVRHVLVPLDGSPYAEAMLEHAVALGRCFQARYTLLRVVKPVIAIGYTLQGQDGHVNHHRLAKEEAAAWSYLNTLAERMRAPGLSVRTEVIASEDPATAILDYVRGVAGSPGRAIDLIAMETHPHGTISRYLGAHTADTVLRGATTPLLLFQPPLPSAAPAETEDALAARA